MSSRLTFENLIPVLVASAALSCLNVACSSDDGSSSDDSPATGGQQATGGNPSTGGTSDNTGGDNATGGAGTGGADATGGASTGGASTGGADATGGASTGGADATGGASTGGAATGGASTGGTASGGAGTGGEPTVTAKACDYGSAVKSCMEFVGSGYSDDEVDAACTAGQVVDGCPDTDAYGTCTMGAGTADETVAYYYTGNGFPADGAPCTQGGGTWQSL
jgi:hypothetical protein